MDRSVVDSSNVQLAKSSDWNLPSTSAFDSHHPPSPQLLSDCVHCGFCLPACPTYALWGEEMDSPRGRIYLMGLGLEGELEMSPTFVGHFDKCLGCMACLTACPSGVQYDKLIEATRSQIERGYRRSWDDRLFRWMLFQLFPHPGRLRLMTLPLWFYERSGLRHIAHRVGVLRALPPRLRAMEQLLPPISLRRLKPVRQNEVSSTQGPRVGLLPGCVQSVFFATTNNATERVLSAIGCDVVVPKGQGCCGALMLHAGREDEAIAFAKRIIDAFEAASVELIAINAAGCGSAMKEYGHLLRDDPVYAQRAADFAAKCRDITEVVLQEHHNSLRWHPIRAKVAYHDACHLRHAQRIADEPRTLLRRIPELELVEIEDATMCCGSAGVYNLLEPGAAAQLGDRKAAHILATSADAIVTGNPGCLLQLRAALQRAGRPLPVLHTIDLLDASLRGLSPETLFIANRT